MAMSSSHPAFAAHSWRANQLCDGPFPRLSSSTPKGEFRGRRLSGTVGTYERYDFTGWVNTHRHATYQPPVGSEDSSIFERDKHMQVPKAFVATPIAEGCDDFTL